MADASPHTTQLLVWLDRIRAGDAAARDELLRGFSGRLERLARRMLRRSPRIRRWAETGDLLQGALVRLLRALEQVRPESVRAFLGLAAEQMRRELLDLARHLYGPQGIASHLSSGHDRADPPDPADDPDDLERWRAFHEGVAELPTDQREVVELVVYHGWTQPQVAELLQVTVRTVQRRRQAAMLRLHALLGETEEGE